MKIMRCNSLARLLESGNGGILRGRTTTIVLLSVLATLGARQAVGQSDPLKNELVGPWKFVSSTTQRDDGSTAWGTDPKGLLIFTDNGRFSLQIMRSDRPRYKSGTRQRASLIENQATTRGTLSYFGTYTVSDPDHMVALHVDSSSYPNLSDTYQKRKVTLVGDTLTQRLRAAADPPCRFGSGRNSRAPGAPGSVALGLVL
jgi:Lipocalin-like domain